MQEDNHIPTANAGLISVIALTVVLLSGCIYVFRTVDVESVQPAQDHLELDVPIKVHLLDGTVALFPSGASSADRRGN